MGQTQVLLLVVCLILVSVAAGYGIYYFNYLVAQSNMDAVQTDLYNLAMSARTHYLSSEILGGGERSFVKITADAEGISLITNTPSNQNGDYTVSVAGTKDQVTLKGIGKHDIDNDGTPTTVEITVYPDHEVMTVINR